MPSTIKTHKYAPKPGTNPLRAAVMRALVESKPDVPAAGVGSVGMKAAGTAAKAVSRRGTPSWVKNREAYKILKSLRKDPDVPPDVRADVFREAAGMKTKGPPMYPPKNK